MKNKKWTRFTTKTKFFYNICINTLNSNFVPHILCCFWGAVSSLVRAVMCFLLFAKYDNASLQSDRVPRFGGAPQTPTWTMDLTMNTALGNGFDNEHRLGQWIWQWTPAWAMDLTMSTGLGNGLDNEHRPEQWSVCYVPLIFNLQKCFASPKLYPVYTELPSQAVTPVEA